MAPGPVVRFAVGPAVAGPRVTALLDELTASLSKRSGVTIEGVALPDYASLGSAMREGRIDLAWLPPIMALEGMRGGELVPLLIPVRHGSATFRAVLFARAASPFRTLPKLVGARAAWVDQNSASGFVVIRRQLVRLGVDLGRAFADEAFLGSHEAVARAVLEGRADVGATYVCMNVRGGISAAGWSEIAEDMQLAIVAESEPIPNDLIAMRKGLPAGVAEAIQKAVLEDWGADDTPARLFRAEGFEPPEPTHFEGLTALLER